MWPTDTRKTTKKKGLERKRYIFIKEITTQARDTAKRKSGDN